MKKIILFLIIMVLIQNCQRNKTNSKDQQCDIYLKMIETSIKFQNKYFPSTEKRICGSLVIFFNQKSCPSCIVELKNYSDLMNRNYFVDTKFCTIKGNYNIKGIDDFITISTVVPDSTFLDIEYPIIFKTNEIGQITNCMAISPDVLYLGFDYIKNYAILYPRSKKNEIVALYPKF